MTRRERLEARVERRQEWAEKASARADQRFATAHKIVDGIPLGQPILVGHHSEKRHRADIDRMASNMSKGVAESKLADHHESKAAGLAAQLDRTVFSDDGNAIEALQARIAEREAESARRKAINAAFKKAPGVDTAAKLAGMVRAGAISESEGVAIAGHFARCHWETRPFPAYSLTNLGANIRRDKERIKEIEQRQARSARAESAGGVVIEGAEWVRVTFAEKPEHEVLEALRAAGFRWGGGSWSGERSKLPALVVEVAP